MTEQLELINLKSDVEELRAHIGKLEHFILKLLDRIVALVRARADREAQEPASTIEDGSVQ